MQNTYDLKRYCVLYVDDEEMALKYFEKAFGREFRVLIASNATDGLKIIEERGEEIGVLLTDQRMPGEKGVQLLERARQLRPRLVRMLITAYADFGVTVDAVNLGNIFRYISKPLQIEDMRNTLRRAMEFFILQQERDDLLSEKLSVLQNLLITDRVISLGVLAAGMGQQLRNPLLAVQAFLNLTPGSLRQKHMDLDRLRDPAFWRDFHDLVVKQAERIADLLGGLPGIGSSSPDSESVDSGTLLQTTVDRYRSSLGAQGIDFQGELTTPLPVLRASAAKLQKALDLVIDCSALTLSTGKRAVVSARTGQTAAGQPSLQVAITDNGAGMPAEAMRSVFDPFFIRTDGPEDFGLKLMGAYFLVYDRGGSVTVQRPPSGVGLSILLDIPVNAPEGVSTGASSREFVTGVLMNDVLWERLLPMG